MGREISIEDVLTGLDDLGIVLDSEGKTVLHVPAFYLPRKKLTLKDISPLLIFKLRTLFSAWSQFSKTVDRPHNGAKGEGSSYYDFEVVLEILIPGDVAPRFCGLAQMVDVFFLLERKFVPARHLVAQHLDVGKFVDGISELGIACFRSAGSQYQT